MGITEDSFAMSVADLYIALVLVGVCIGIGWLAHEYATSNEERLQDLEQSNRNNLIHLHKMMELLPKGKTLDEMLRERTRATVPQ
jgi:hypothetical protein